MQTGIVLSWLHLTCEKGSNLGHWKLLLLLFKLHLFILIVVVELPMHDSHLESMLLVDYHQAVLLLVGCPELKTLEGIVQLQLANEETLIVDSDLSLASHNEGFEGAGSYSLYLDSLDGENETLPLQMLAAYIVAEDALIAGENVQQRIV